MKKSILSIIILLLVILSLWLWFYGPNYILPLPNRPVIEKTAIQMPVNRFVIVKEDDKYAAIRILRLTWKKGAVYECWYQGDGSGDFKSHSLIYQKGKVYERYAETPISSSEVFFKDQGSKLNIECGPIKIRWSAGNWIYFTGYGTEKPLFEIAPTMISDLSQLDVKDRNLTWVTRKDN